MRIKNESGNKATVTAGLIYGGGRTVPRSGAKPIDFADDHKLAEFRLTESGGSWRVAFLGYLS